MRFEMLSFKNSLFFFLPYTWGVMMVPFILLRVFHRWWWSQEETGFSKSFLFGWVLRENWRQVLAISWRSVPSAVRHVSSIANNSSEIPLQRVTCWRRGLYSECDTREAWEIVFSCFPSAHVWPWPACSWMLFWETSGGLCQLVAGEIEAVCLSPLENQGRGEVS